MQFGRDFGFIKGRFLSLRSIWIGQLKGINFTMLRLHATSKYSTCPEYVKYVIVIEFHTETIDEINLNCETYTKVHDIKKMKSKSLTIYLKLLVCKCMGALCPVPETYCIKFLH